MFGVSSAAADHSNFADGGGGILEIYGQRQGQVQQTIKKNNRNCPKSIRNDNPAKSLQSLEGSTKFCCRKPWKRSLLSKYPSWGKEDCFGKPQVWGEQQASFKTHPGWSPNPPTPAWGGTLKIGPSKSIPRRNACTETSSSVLFDHFWLFQQIRMFLWRKTAQNEQNNGWFAKRQQWPKITKNRQQWSEMT